MLAPDIPQGPTCTDSVGAFCCFKEYGACYISLSAVFHPCLVSLEYPPSKMYCMEITVLPGQDDSPKETYSYYLFILPHIRQIPQLLIIFSPLPREKRKAFKTLSLPES